MGKKAKMDSQKELKMSTDDPGIAEPEATGGRGRKGSRKATATARVRSSAGVEAGIVRNATGSSRKRKQPAVVVVTPQQNGESSDISNGGKGTFQTPVSSPSNLRTNFQLPTSASSGLGSTAKRVRVIAVNQNEVQPRILSTPSTSSSTAGAGQAQQTMVMVKQGSRGQKVYRILPKPASVSAGVVKHLEIASKSVAKVQDSSDDRTAHLKAGLLNFLKQWQSTQISTPFPNPNKAKAKTKGLKKDKSTLLGKEAPIHPELPESPPLSPTVEVTSTSDVNLPSVFPVEMACSLLKTAVQASSSSECGYGLNRASSFFSIYNGKTPNCFGSDFSVQPEQQNSEISGKEVQLFDLLPEILQKEIMAVYLNRRDIRISFTKPLKFDGAFVVECTLTGAAFKWVPTLRIAVTEDYPAELPVVCDIGLHAISSPISSAERKIGFLFRPIIRGLHEKNFRFPWLIKEWTRVVNTIYCKRNLNGIEASAWWD